MSGWRWLSGTVALLLVFGAVAGAWYAYAELDRPVTKVVIEGHVDRAERIQIEQVVGPHIASGVLSADVAAIRDGLEALGWTREVRVRRVWPDKIAVALDHSTPIAYWNKGQLLGDDGRAYPYVGQNVSAALPHLFGGPAYAKEVVSHYGVLRELFGRAGLTVTHAGRDAKGNWWLRLDQRIGVQLGNRDILDRARRVVGLYARHLSAEPERIARIDARYANGVAVAWIATPAASAAPLTTSTAAATVSASSAAPVATAVPTRLTAMAVSPAE